jgi:hypothetical protein
MGFAGSVGAWLKNTLSPTLSLKGEGAVLSGREVRRHPHTFAGSST